MLNMINNKRIIKLAAAALLLILLTGCSFGNYKPVTGENYYLDTVCMISIYAMRADASADADGDEAPEVRPAAEMKEEAEAAIKEAFDLCASLDKTLSRTQAASDISKANSAKGNWVEISEDTAVLVEAGIEYSELSGGDFDISIGGVTDLWDFHADPEDAKLPDADELAEAVKHVDYNNVEVYGNNLRLLDHDARVDLGGIAKGYIGDRMAEVLEKAGVTSGIINLGGNVICIGGKYTGKQKDGSVEDFAIGIETPYSNRTKVVGKVYVQDKTLVTSGVYERNIEVDGKTYHHILSTETGYPVDTDLDAVTLIADKGKSMDADALSTICLIKGYGEARKLIENTDGVEAVFILSDGTIEQTEGAGFE